jgi:flagellar biosynthetic protein FliP
MEQVFVSAWSNGISPLLNNEISIEQAFERSLEPFRQFMISRVDEETFYTMSALRPEQTSNVLDVNAPLSLIIPSFLLSEISLAFQIGFLVFLPFLIIDLVVAAVLMSMGMMMVPPAIVSLPFKLAFFVVADGWSLIASALVRSYS